MSTQTLAAWALVIFLWCFIAWHVWTRAALEDAILTACARDPYSVECVKGGR